MRRTLQASPDLNNNGDKVIFRQFRGGSSSFRTLKSGHTAIRADQFDPDGWQFPDSAELCQNDDQGPVTNDMSAIAHLHKRPRCTCTRDPDARTTRYHQETLTQYPHAATYHRRRSHRTTTKLQDLIRRTPPRHHPGSRGRNMSGIYGRATEATSPREARRHCKLWLVVTPRTSFAVRTTRGKHRYAGSGTHDAEHHGTTRGSPA